MNELQCFGVSAAEIQLLVDAGLATVGSVLQKSTRHLSEIKGLSEAKIEKIKEGVCKIVFYVYRTF